MTQDDALQKIDELMDAGVGIGIKVSRLDPALGDAFHSHLQAWRAFAHEAIGSNDDGLDAFNRHLTRNGE